MSWRFIINLSLLHAHQNKQTMINYTYIFKDTCPFKFCRQDITESPDFLAEWYIALGLLEGKRESPSLPNHFHDYIWKKKGGMYVTVYCSFRCKWNCTSFWFPFPVHIHHIGWFGSSEHLSKTWKRSSTTWIHKLKFSFQFCHSQFNSTNTAFIRFLLCGKKQMWLDSFISSSNIYFMSFMCH